MLRRNLAQRLRFTYWTRLLVAMICSAAVGVIIGTTAEAKQAAACTGQPGKRAGPPPAQAPTTKLDRGTKVFDLRFDQGRAPKSRTRFLTATPPLTDAGAINVQIEEDLVTTEDRTISPGEGLNVTKDVSGDGNLQVCVSLDPKQVSDLHAGRYVGDVVVSGPGGQAVSVPIQATFRSSSSRAWVSAGVGAFVGLVLRVLSELAAGRRKKARWATLRAYLLHWSFWSTLVSTPLLAAAGYYTLYADNPTWGALESDGWKLFATCLGFQLGGVGLVDILQRFTGSTPQVAAAGTVAATAAGQTSQALRTS